MICGLTNGQQSGQMTCWLEAEEGGCSMLVHRELLLLAGSGCWQTGQRSWEEHEKTSPSHLPFLWVAAIGGISWSCGTSLEISSLSPTSEASRTSRCLHFTLLAHTGWTGSGRSSFTKVCFRLTVFLVVALSLCRDLSAAVPFPSNLSDIFSTLWGCLCSSPPSSYWIWIWLQAGVAKPIRL